MREEKLNLKQVLDLAVRYHTQGRLAEAETLYKRILEKNPYHTDALHLLGVIAHQLGKHEEAVKDISRAIQLNPVSAIYYSNLGMAYDALGKDDEATENFRKALERDFKYDKAHLAHYNLGVYFMERGDIDRALEHYNKAIELDKNFFEARWNRSLILLLLGKFKEGWDEYECRFKKEKPTDIRVFDKPKWNGSLLGRKRILILSEQGFGDTIHFIRYISLVKERGGYVIFECKKELRRLFENFPGIDEFVEKDKGIPKVEFDCYIHLMSLPGIFNTNFDSIPNKVPYIWANPALVEKFKDIYIPVDCTKKQECIDRDSLKKCNIIIGNLCNFNNNLKIGIVWAGNPQQENDKNRSTSFEKFRTLKDISGVSFFSLQKGEASSQLTDPKIIDLERYIADFADTAAIIENLNLVISVDTSVAHLSGAMGKPTWVLLSAAADWRWLLQKKDSPWYQNMKLFRQRKLGDWDSVFWEVREELRNILYKK